MKFSTPCTTYNRPIINIPINQLNDWLVLRRSIACPPYSRTTLLLSVSPRSPRQFPATHSLTTTTHPRLIIRRRVRPKLPLHAERALEHAVRLPGHRRAERGRRVDALVALAARAGIADVGDDALRVGDFEGWGGG